MSETSKPDMLNEIGVLKRREIEARVLAPLLQALGERFGRDEVLAVAREVIIRVAREQGSQLAQAMGGDSLAQFAASLEAWKKDEALQTELLVLNEREFTFNVTRCRYAELYRALGLEELGATLSCNRDAALIEGFNPQIKLTRTQTIMQGAPSCDFRYVLQSNSTESGSDRVSPVAPEAENPGATAPHTVPDSVLRQPSALVEKDPNT